MFETLLNSINQKVILSAEEQETVKSFFKQRSIKKGQFLVQQDEVCVYAAFVEKGVLRSYTADNKGNEHILQFAVEGWWINDMNSFLTGQPSMLNIQVLEDASLLLITREDNEKLFEVVPRMERYFRILIQGALIAIQRRLIGSMSQTAEEKYSRLLNTFPGIFQKVPQHMIASYLGFSAETLSRIRKQISLRKKDSNLPIL